MPCGWGKISSDRGSLDRLMCVMDVMGHELSVGKTRGEWWLFGANINLITYAQTACLSFYYPIGRQGYNIGLRYNCPNCAAKLQRVFENYKFSEPPFAQISIADCVEIHFSSSFHFILQHLEGFRGYRDDLAMLRHVAVSVGFC